jgi:hypothetical protein
MPLFGGPYFIVREYGFDFLKHPRQSDGERYEGAVQIGRVVHFGSCERLARS